MIKAALYARVSTREQIQAEHSLNCQIEEIKKYALQQKIEIIDEYIDNADNTGKPQLRHLLEDADFGKFEVVIVYALDRIDRKLKDTYEFIESLEQKNIKLISLEERFDTTTAYGKVALKMLLSFYELEQQILSPNHL